MAAAGIAQKTIEAVVMNDSKKAEDRRVESDDAEGLHVESVVVSGLPVEPRLRALDH
jgi:hypothetical protein